MPNQRTELYSRLTEDEITCHFDAGKRSSFAFLKSSSQVRTKSPFIPSEVMNFCRRDAGNWTVEPSRQCASTCFAAPR